MDARIIWIASLIAGILVAIFFRRRGKLELLFCLYAAFCFGFVTKAGQGGFEARLILPILALVLLSLVLAASWVSISKAKGKSLARPVLALAIVLVLGAYTIPVAEEALGFQLSALFNQPDGQLQVHFIDVGQGDSILIHAGGTAVLIDAGPRAAGETVVNYLRSQGIAELDLVIATHPHEDHIGGLLEVLKQFKVGEVMDPGVVHTSRTFEQYLDLIDSKGIEFTVARTGMSRDLSDGVRLEILHPTRPKADQLNDASIVARVSIGRVAFLFTGDAGIGAEREILASAGSVPANVLKLGHHGSSDSTSREFFQAVRPAYAVITLGADNPYGYPHREIVALLADTDVLRTDLHGHIVFSTDGSALDVKSTRGGGEK